MNCVYIDTVIKSLMSTCITFDPEVTIVSLTYHYFTIHKEVPLHILSNLFTVILQSVSLGLNV